MIHRLSAWPALRTAEMSPATLFCEVGIWGKVHGAPTDFRWIAKSPQFRTDNGPQNEVALGAEDHAVRCGLWRRTETFSYAVKVYPSRAVDRSGRAAPIEKTFLSWREPRIPAAMGALALLGVVAEADECLWWDDRRNSQWQDPEYCKPLPPPAIQCDPDKLEENVEKGIRELGELVSLDRLARFFARLEAGARPALLPGLAGPLTPLGLGVLLLPWPARFADQLSLAGWIPSSRLNRGVMAELWTGLACDKPPQELVEPDPPLSVSDDAWLMAEALLESSPSLLRPQNSRSSLGIAKPAGRAEDAAGVPARAASAVDLIRAGKSWSDVQLLVQPLTLGLRMLIRFSLDPHAWWLKPEEFDHCFLGQLPRFAAGSLEARLLDACSERVQEEVEGSVSPRGWRVKAELLRAARLVLIQGAASGQTLPTGSSAVPPLRFLALLTATARADFELECHDFQRLLESSRNCPFPELFSGRSDPSPAARGNLPPQNDPTEAKGYSSR